MYTQTWSHLCSSPGGCEHPECTHLCVSLPPSHRQVFFSSALQQKWVIQNEEVTPQLRDSSWLWLHCSCLGYWTLLSKVHQLRLLLSWTQHCNVFKWSCLLCLLPSPSLFCMLAEWQGKWCLKIPCIGFVLSLSAFQFSWMCMCAA